jgi:hypothetical protein
MLTDSRRLETANFHDSRLTRVGRRTGAAKGIGRAAMVRMHDQSLNERLQPIWLVDGHHRTQNYEILSHCGRDPVQGCRRRTLLFRILCPILLHNLLPGNASVAIQSGPYAIESTGPPPGRC